MTDAKRMLEGLSVDRLGSHIQALEGVRHPRAAPEALVRAEEYIWECFSAQGYSVSAQPFTDMGFEYRNILAERPGVRYPKQRVILLAHFDTVSDSPGANDNASGVAGMLEIARVLHPLEFERSLLFVGVNLEERAVENDPDTPYARGSRALAELAFARGWEIPGVIDLEEIAFAGDEVVQTSPEGIPILLSEVGDFIAVVGNERSRGLVEGFLSAIQVYQIALPAVPMVVPGNGELLPDTRRSDHAPFWDRGYSAIMVTDTANFRTPHYHQPSDTLETLNLEFAVRVSRAAAGLMVALAGEV